MKQIVYIDMDNVMVNFLSGIAKRDRQADELLRVRA